MTKITKIKLIFFVIVALVLVTVIFQNTDHVEFHILFWDPISISKTLLLVITSFIGFIFGIMFKFFFFNKKS